MTWNDHHHRGEYADERHDHDLDYAEKHHRHYDLETDDKTAQQGITCLRDEVAELRGELDAAYGAVRDLRHQFDAVLAEIRALDRLRPSCVICHEAAADRQTVSGPACTECAGDLPDDGPDPEHPETWAFPGPDEFGPGPEAASALVRIAALEAANVRLVAALREATGRHDDTLRAGMAGEADLAIAAELTEAFASFSAALDGEPGQPGEQPEPEPYDPGPEIDDEGGMSEYRYPLPEDYQQGQS